MFLSRVWPLGDKGVNKDAGHVYANGDTKENCIAVKAICENQIATDQC